MVRSLAGAGQPFLDFRNRLIWMIGWWRGYIYRNSLPLVATPLVFPRDSAYIQVTRQMSRTWRSLQPEPPADPLAATTTRLKADLSSSLLASEMLALLDARPRRGVADSLKFLSGQSPSVEAEVARHFLALLQAGDALPSRVDLAVVRLIAESSNARLAVLVAAIAAEAKKPKAAGKTIDMIASHWLSANIPFLGPDTQQPHRPQAGSQAVS